jgi:transposase
VDSHQADIDDIPSLLSLAEMTKLYRPAIIHLSKNGKTPKQISNLLAVPLQTVRDAIKRYNKLGHFGDHAKSGRPASVCTLQFKERIRSRIRRNPLRSMRKMARDLQISDSSVRKVVKDMLQLRPYKLKTAQQLTEKMKITRLECARRMETLVGDGRLHSVVFTDEKIFSVECHHNHQNDRQLLRKGSSTGPDATIVSRSHFPTSVMVWGGICATGKTPLVFVDKGAKINAAYYQEKILLGALLPWGRQHFGQAEWALQQDWAPAHSAKTTMALCRQEFPGFWDKDVWPPYSPDLNPLDYSIWGILESKVCSKPHASLESLKRSLCAAWDDLKLEQLATIVDNFSKRLRACISAKGGYFEKALC